jgi:hypothetical protein
MEPQFIIAAVMLCIDKLCYSFIYFSKIIRSILALKMYTDLQNAVHTLCWTFVFKVKVPRNRTEGPEGGRGIALLFLDLGATKG